MKLWSIAGNSQKLDGGSMFGNAPRAMWTKWATPDALNRIPLATRGLLATPLNGKTVLFETGIGAFFEPKLRARFGVQEERHVLLDSLREAGFDHTDIDVVVLSHLHFDHAGGLLDRKVEAFGHKLTEKPSEVFKQHVWISPFPEEDVVGLANLIGADRVLMGSDWPHPEGNHYPAEYVECIESLPAESIRRIMRENALELIS